MKNKQKENLNINKTNEKDNIKEKNKNTSEIVNKIFYNVLLAVIFMIYFFILNIGYNSVMIERLEKVIHLFSGIFLLIGLIFLEKSYKIDDGKKAITAIELLVMSMHSLSIMHIVTKYKFEFQIYLTASSYVFAIYYVLKSIIIYTKGRKEYLDELSDVKEIVKKEEPIKKEATKKKKQEEKEKINVQEKNIEKSKKKEPKKTSTKKGTTKKTTTRKTETKEPTTRKTTTKKTVTKKAIDKKTATKTATTKKNQKIKKR